MNKASPIRFSSFLPSRSLLFYSNGLYKCACTDTYTIPHTHTHTFLMIDLLCMLLSKHTPLWRGMWADGGGRVGTGDSEIHTLISFTHKRYNIFVLPYICTKWNTHLRGYSRINTNWIAIFFEESDLAFALFYAQPKCWINIGHPFANPLSAIAPSAHINMYCINHINK